MLDSDDYDMSFSGLKTAALYWLQDNAPKTESNTYYLEPKTLSDFCASFEQAIVLNVRSAAFDPKGIPKAC